jgi:cytochrome c peroxidase
LGFSDDVEFSLGFANRMTNDDVPSALNPHSGDDGDINQMAPAAEVAALKTMLKRSLFNHAETGMKDETLVVTKVQSAAYYAELFNNAYGNQQVNIEKVADALTAFTESINTSVKATGANIKTDDRFANPFNK